MFTAYLSFLGSHPYAWGTLGVILFAAGCGFALPGFGVRRRRNRPRRRMVFALYLWAAAVLCFVAVFFVPLRLRVFTETALYYHGGLLVAAFLLLWLRRLGLFLAFALVLLAGVTVPLYHQTWNPLRKAGEAAVIRVLAVSSGSVSLEVDAADAGSQEIWGPIELEGSLVTVQAEIVELPDPLFLLGFVKGYRILSLSGLDDGGRAVDEWAVPGVGDPVPFIDEVARRRVETVTFRPFLLERYAVILRPEGDEVLSYRQL
ncbi:MAG: hypothetical protein ACLFPV_01600 [Spirochaetaceae bacterium]